MGYTHTRGASKGDIVKQLLENTPSRTIVARAVRGNVLWTVERLQYVKDDGTPVDTNVIGCYLLDNEKGFGWGYKDLCEAVHPYYYSCPLKFLDMAPEACPEWRARVREYGQKSEVVKGLKVGTRVRLVPGCRLRGKDVDVVTVTSLRPLLADANGLIMRLPKRLIAEVLD